MTNTIKKLIRLLLILTTFMTGFLNFGNVTTSAYINIDYREYLLDCPHSDPYYCSSSNIPRTANNCYTYKVNYCNDYGSTSNNQNMNANCTFVIYTCYYNTNNYCKYLTDQNCVNITVNQPKSNLYPLQPTITPPIYTDPIRNCALNTGNCYAGVNYDNSFYAFQDYTLFTDNSALNFTLQPDRLQNYDSPSIPTNQNSYNNYSLDNTETTYSQHLAPNYSQFYSFDSFYNGKI